MRSSRSRPAFFIIMALIIVFLGGLFLGYVFIQQTVTARFGPPADYLTPVQKLSFTFELFTHREQLGLPQRTHGEEIIFRIDEGESISMVCLRLEQDGLIADAELFRAYLIYTGLDRYLQAGVYNLNPEMSPIQIAADMLDSTPENGTLSILAGWRMEEVAAALPTSGLSIPPEVFLDAVTRPDAVYFEWLPIESAPTLEGFLYPGVYSLPRETDVGTLLETILGNFTASLGNELIDGFSRQGLTVYEGVILASIIEKEAVVDEEKPLIASVFFNRLAIGMRLETDPTVQYALGYLPDLQTWWKSPLSAADLAVDSPYNTYQTPGLPPGPIANPDLSSLQAVAYPAETPYFYFRATCDSSGRHAFAITYEEHLNNACE